MTAFSSEAFNGIITCDEDALNILREPCRLVEAEQWDAARKVVQHLCDIRENVLMGGAALSAPQLGISLAIFIYTSDRTTESLKAVINPTIEPIGKTMVESYESCFSVPLCCVKLKRWEKIKVSYQNVEGEFIDEMLEGFASKVFQHEVDHLKGKLTIDHETAEVIEFSDAQSFQNHMEKIYGEDSKRYSQG